MSRSAIRRASDTDAMTVEQVVASRNAEADEVHVDKEKKLLRLQQMTNLRTKAKFQSEEIETSHRKKFEFAQEMLRGTKTIEDLSAQLPQVFARCDRFEESFREADAKHAIALTKMEEVRQYSSDALKSLEDKLFKAINMMEEKRLREMQELEKVVALRDKNLTQAIHREVNDEANARALIGNDCTRIAEHVKEVKTFLTEDIMKLQASIQGFQSKNYDEFAKLQELISAEKAVRERAFVSVQSQAVQRAADSRAVFEAKCEELRINQQASYSQMTNLLDKIRVDFTAAVKNVCNDVECLDKKQFTRIEEIEADRKRKCNEITHSIEVCAADSKVCLNEILVRIEHEKVERSAEVGRVREELATEHLRREEDESAIINMLELCLQQASNLVGS